MNYLFRTAILVNTVLIATSGQVFALEGSKVAQPAVKAGQAAVKAGHTAAKTGPAAIKAAQTGVKAGLSGAKTAVKTGLSTAKAALPAPKPQADSNEETATAAAATPVVDAHCESLAGRIRDYRTNPEAASWDAVLRELKGFVQQPQTAHLSQAALFAANPGLVDIGAKITDFSGGRIWSFPRINECQHMLLQWANVTAGPEEAVLVHGKRRVVRGPSLVAWRSDYVHVTSGVQAKEAKIVGSSTVSTVGKKVVRVDSPRSLVIVGMDRSGNSYLHAFRISSGAWNEVADVFSGVPPYVLQSLSGKISFSGNDLVLSIGSSPAPAPAVDSADKKAGAVLPPAAASNGYRLVLRLVGGKYQMEGGKNGEDGAFATAMQFANALQQGRADMAKAWLADPTLVSIPKYIGYFSKPAPTPKIIPMANPLNGSTRYRLITSMKEDLILDIGRTKTLPFAVKAIFIAPPDPLATRILSNLQAHDAAVRASKDGSKESGKDSKDDSGK